MKIILFIIIYMNSDTEEKNKLKPIEEISLDIKNISRDIDSIRTDLQYIKLLIRAKEETRDLKKPEPIKSGWFFS